MKRMSAKPKLVILFIFLFFPLAASADVYFAIDEDYDYEFSIIGNPNEKKAVVSGLKKGKTLTTLNTIPPKIKFKQCVESGVHYIADPYPSYVVKDTIECNVIGIGDSAFKGNPDLETVTIPSHIELLGKSAFANCTNLRRVEMSDRSDIPEGLFAGCVNLVSFQRLSLLNSFKIIGDSALKNCKKLSTDIFLSKDLSRIGKEAFYGCESINTIEVRCSEESIVIDNDAFYGCTGLKKVNCTDLSSWLNITFSNPAANPLSCSHKLFLGNNLVTSLEIPNFATKIPAYAFYDCTCLSEVIMNNSNKHIIECGTMAFYGCENLNKVTIPNMGYWCDIVFADRYSNPLYYAHHMWEPPSAMHSNGQEISKLEIPNSVKHINAYAFYGANSLDRLDIGGGIRHIGNEAFADCLPRIIESRIIVPFSISINVFSPAAYTNSELIVPNRDFNTGSCSLDKYKNTPAWSNFQNIRATGHYVNHNTTTNTLTITAEGHGTVLYNNTEIMNDTKSFQLVYDEYYGVDLKMAVTPELGYEIGRLLVDGVSLPDSLIGDTIIIEGAIGDIDVTVNFTEPEAPITSITYNSSIYYQGLEYALTDDGIAMVLGVRELSDSTITIPAHLALTEEDFSTPKNNYRIYPGLSGSCGMFAMARANNESDSIKSRINNISSTASTEIDKNKPQKYAVKIIGNGAFKNNSNITKVVIEEGVTTIWSEAFSGCQNLKEISLPNTIRYIGWLGFTNCSMLESITIPKSVKTISIEVFDGCSLKNVNYYAEKVSAFQFKGVSSLSNVTIGSSVKIIDDCAFEESGVKNITFANNSSLKSIKNRAFYKCMNLENLMLPEGITDIGEMAFGNCDALQTINLPNSLVTLENGVFFACPKLERVSVGDGLKRIEQATFYGCDNLTEITFSENSQLEYIGTWAFMDCTKLRSFLLPKGVKELGEAPFEGCINIETFRFSDALTEMSMGMFSNWVNLKSFTFGMNPKIKSIPINAFGGCKNLESFVVPNSVETIGEQAFVGSGLKNISFSNTLLRIGGGAFEDCCNLTSVNIPNSVVSVEGYAFYGCRGLTSVVIGNGVTSIGSSTFEDCCNLTSLTIGNAVTSIGSSAFEDCYNLTSVNIPNSVVSVEDFAFSGCRGLTSVNISNSVVSIGKYAFSSCNGLTSVTIPNSVTSIGKSAFSECNNLKTFNMGNGLTEWDASIIQRCPAIENIQWSDGIKKIEDKAFYNKKNLKSFTFGPNPTLEEIGDRAFSLSGLTSFEMPPSVKIVGEAAFNYCTSMESITLSPLLTVIPSFMINGTIVKEIIVPASVTSTGYSSLGSENMTDVTILATIPPTELEDSWDKGYSPMPISYAKKATLHVPLGTKAAYAVATGWKSFGSIVEFGEEPILSGDLNGDGEVNGTDLVAQTNLILTGVYDALADLNHDSMVNGTDFVLMVNQILVINAARSISTTTQTLSPVNLSIKDFTIKEGETKEMFINMNNPNTGITLVQFDLFLPNGLTIVESKDGLNVDISGRTTWKNHSLQVCNMGNKTRFLLASSANTLIDGSNGSIIGIRLLASNDFNGGDIQLDNQLLVTPEADEIKPVTYTYSLGVLTGVGAYVIDGIADVYTLTGSKVCNGALGQKALPKGFYVVNGKKVIVK